MPALDATIKMRGNQAPWHQISLGGNSSLRRGYYILFPGGSDGEKSACNAGYSFQSLGQEDPPEKEMATHSSILAWIIPWTKQPGRLYSPWGPKESDMTE